MDELQVRNNNRQLPSTPDDLYKISVVGREQLNAMRAGIRALDKIEAISEDDIETIAKKREERLKEAQLLSEWILQAEIRLGELLSQLPQTPGKRSDLGPGNTGMTRSKKEILKELGISRQLCATFERLAQHPEIVSAVQQKAVEAGEIMTRTAVLVEIKAQQRPYIAHNSGDSEWMSPSHLVECARKVMGKIDLDPCSCPKANLTVKADMYYTKISDGLQQAWYGHVWLNPPYNQVEAFVGKLIQSLDTVTECILLLNNGTETAWAQNLATVASSVCFPAGRTTFERCDDNSPGKSGKPMQGQIIVYLGPNPDLFENTYQTYGWCARIRHEKKTENIPDNIIRNNPSLEETD